MRIVLGIGAAISLAAIVVHAGDPALPLTVTGYNADIVAEGSDTAANTTTPFDYQGNVFYDSTYDAAHGNNGGALPSGQTITDGDGNQYNLASATGNNALVISSDNNSGTFGVSYADNASLTGLLLLGTSADGDTILDYTLNFVGGTTASGSFTLANWYNPSASGTFNSMGRVGQFDQYNGETGRAFSLYTAGFDIPEEDVLLRLDSITLTYDEGNVGNGGIFPTAAILGVSAFDPVVPVPEPTTGSLAICGALALAAAAGRKFFKS
ncbi:MAG TPA: hypothetical protein VG347_08815 [Verrucomicrobiae bacterium]|nr:hypothetical protein [Verrucomicrobiae bacterium]